MKTAVIFGYGQGYKDESERLLRQYQILAIADNDPAKFGSIRDGYNVIPPQMIKDYAPDMILIGVYKGADSIKKQCRMMGFGDENIYVAGQPTRVFKNDSILLNNEDWFDVPPGYTTPGTAHLLKYKIMRDDAEFLFKLRQLKQTCKEINVPVSCIAVTSGGILQAYGIRASKALDDVDIIMTSGFRRLYGSGLVIVSDICEMHPENEYDISDDEIILDPNNHFIYEGIKFVNLEIYIRLLRIQNRMNELEGKNITWIKS